MSLLPIQNHFLKLYFNPFCHSRPEKIIRRKPEKLMPTVFVPKIRRDNRSRNTHCPTKSKTLRPIRTFCIAQSHWYIAKTFVKSLPTFYCKRPGFFIRKPFYCKGFKLFVLR